MERRRLGRLGHDSSVLIYGAAALSEIDQDAADRSVQQALDAGINQFSQFETLCVGSSIWRRSPMQERNDVRGG